MKNCGSVLSVLLTLFSFGRGAKLPSTFEICKRNDPDVEGCFARAIEHALPYVKEPIPDLAVPSIDPVRIESVTVDAGTTGAVNVTQRLKNVEIYNVVNTKVPKTELTLGAEKVQLVIHFYNEQFRIEADYDIGGKLLLLPIVGHGKAHMYLNDLRGEVALKGEFREKKGQTYVKLTDMEVKVNPGNVRFNLENLFNGDERLGAEMNRLLNENWKDVFDDVKPAYVQALTVFFKSIFAAFFNKIAYDELFPPQ